MGVMLFLNTQHGVGRCTGKPLVMKWANVLKEYSKESLLKANTASHNNASCYTATDGFLEHSPSAGSLSYKEPALQKMILGACFWILPCANKQKIKLITKYLSLYSCYSAY